jgi:hypothetical protein
MERILTAPHPAKVIELFTFRHRLTAQQLPDYLVSGTHFLAIPSAAVPQGFRACPYPAWPDDLDLFTKSKRQPLEVFLVTHRNYRL